MVVLNVKISRGPKEICHGKGMGFWKNISVGGKWISLRNSKIEWGGGGERGVTRIKCQREGG